MVEQSEIVLPEDIDNRHAYMGAIITITIISVLLAWLRMYTRLFISRNAWWDDWVMFAASLFTILTNAILCRAFELGLGRHIYYVPKKQIPDCFKWLWAAEPTNLFALYAVRVSIALFFLRLVPKHQKLYRRIIWVNIWGLSISNVYVVINYFIQCRPIKKVWLPDTPGTCVSAAVYAAAPWAYQAVSILSDIALVSIPLLMFRSLKLPRRTKIGVIALCCLGIFTCVIAIVKTALLPALFDHHDLDKTWSLAQLCFWAPVEICVGMICGSLPCLKPLYSYIKRGGMPVTESSLSKGYASMGSDSYRRHGPPVSIKLEDRSKSDEWILPQDGRERDLESALPTPKEAPAGPTNSKDSGKITKTTEVNFQSAPVRGQRAENGIPRVIISRQDNQKEDRGW